MPGLAIVFAPRALPQHLAAVRRMLDCMRHQPESAAGWLTEAGLGLTAGWVAHAGSQAARESAAAQAGPAGLLLSGECHRPPGSQAIEEWDGGFAGLLIDRTRQQARLFNDRFGLERLYVAEKDETVYVASEAKALLAVLPELRGFDEDGVAQFLAFGSTLQGRTLFRGVRLLPGASDWQRSSTRWTARARYFEPSGWERLPALPDEEFQERLESLMPRLVARSISGHQPVGLSLTGGLDTRMIVACLPRSGTSLQSYTYAAEGAEQLLDLRIARQVAERRAMDHRVLAIGSDFVRDFDAHFSRTVYVSDGLAGVMGTHELVLSEHARSIAPVRLTGNFGSEVLRSMSTFKRSGPGDALLAPPWQRRVKAAVDEQRAEVPHPVTHAAFHEVPWHLAGLPAASRSQLTVRTPFMSNELVELAYRARPALRLVPGPCQRLIHRHDAPLAALPTDRGLAWTGQSGAPRWPAWWASATFKLDYWHKQGLPDRLAPLDGALSLLDRRGLLGQHKFLAYRVWFRNELAGYARDMALDPATRGMPFWDQRSLSDMAGDHVTGKANRLTDIHAVLTLAMVQRRLFAADNYRPLPQAEIIGATA